VRLPWDALWFATDFLSRYAYSTLLKRGFTSENITFLSPGNIDGDGENDVDGFSSRDNLKSAIENLDSNIPFLTIYLVDHGVSENGDIGFCLNENETLFAQDLGKWLNSFQAASNCHIMIIMDFCGSGGFLSHLSPPPGKERILIASAREDETAMFIKVGETSFSRAFWDSVSSGSNIRDAFLYGMDIIVPHNQHPILDDNGNLAENTTIGISLSSSEKRPHIGAVVGSQVLGGRNSADLWAKDVTGTYEIDKVWAYIVPPDTSSGTGVFDPVTELPEVTLLYNMGNGRYEGAYSQFDKPGSYKIIFYAEDVRGNVSTAKLVYVHQTDFSERAILVVGDGPYNSDEPWGTSNYLGNYAYMVFVNRWFNHDSIFYLNGNPDQDIDGNGETNEIDAVPTKAKLEEAITEWGRGANKLILYLIGGGNNSGFSINADEYITPKEIDTWLDTFQEDTGAEVYLVADFSESGRMISTPPEGKTRIQITSAGTDHSSKCLFDGRICFSQMFLNHVFNGRSLWDAYTSVNAVWEHLFYEDAMLCLDDNGNAIANEDADGILARNAYIGIRSQIGVGDIPVIEKVNNTIMTALDEPFTLWAERVFDLDGISKVMASILTSEGTEVEKNTFAWNHETERYEYEHHGLPKGTCFAVVTAEDRKGNISNPYIVTIYSGVDINGEDDTLDTANAIILNQTPRQHYFHDAGDADWAKFYGIANEWYEIGTSELGDKCDTVVGIYDSESNLLLHKNNGGIGENEFLSWQCSEDGVYYVRVSHISDKACGQGTSYKLWVYCPFGGVPGTLKGRVMDEAGNGIGGAVLKSDICNITGISESNGYYTINPVSGIHTITVTAAGFKAQGQEGVVVTSEGNVYLDFILEPLLELVSIKIEILSGGLVDNALTEVGQSVQFKATGIYNDASTEVMTGCVTWNSSDTSKGAIGTTGLFKALAKGSTYVTATLEGVTSNRVIMNVQAPEKVNIDFAQLPEIIDAGETVDFGPAISGGTGAGFVYAIDSEPAYGAGILSDGKFSVDETKAFAGDYVIRVTDRKNEYVWDTYTIKVSMKLEPNSFVMREDIGSQTFTLKGATAGTTFTVTQYDQDGNDVSDSEGYGNFDNGDGGSPAEVFTYTLDDIDEIKSFKIRFVAVTPDESLENAGLHELTSGIYRVIPMDRFSITVSDTNSNAIADANVSIDYPDITAKTTDVNGRAEFILPDAGNTFSYAVSSTGYVSKKFSSGEKAVSVSLEAAGDTITGIVEDMSDNPLTNVSLLAYQSSNFQTKYDTKSVTNGSYTINLPVGSPQNGWVVVASHEDYVPVLQTDQPVGTVDFTDTNNLQKRTTITSVTATMAGDTVLLGITADPPFTSAGQTDITIVNGSGSLGNPFFSGGTISVTYNAVENFTLIIKADTSEDNDPNSGYRAILSFTYVANETSTGSIHSGIDLGTSRLYLNANTQTAYVNMPVAGVINDATIVIKQVPKTMDSTATKASPIYIRGYGPG